jgi:hypothetical protein
MAQYNEILAGRFNRFVQKHFSMKGREGMPTLSADLAMQMAFNSGAENRYLESWDLFGRLQSFAAPGAGNFTVFQLRNPAGSGVVAVVNRAQWSETIASTTIGTQVTLLVVRGATTDQNSVISAFAWDQRSQRVGSSAILSVNTAAVAAIGGTPFGVANISQLAGTLGDFIPPGGEIPVLPGGAVQIFSGSQNDTASGAFWWRERALESSELT